MHENTYGDSPAALYLADVLANETGNVRGRATSSLSDFNKMMNAIALIPDPSTRIRLIQLVPTESGKSHPELVTTLINNLRVARKRHDVAAANEAMA